MLIILLTLGFGIVKLQHLLERRNPIINMSRVGLGDNERYSLSSKEFNGAFAVEDFGTGAGISDPRYVKWVTAYVQRIDDQMSWTWYPMHQCTRAEIEKFDPPNNAVTK